MKIRHAQRKVTQLVKMRDSIHLNPAWQRGPVWTTPKQALLVDSILRGYDIPMIYLRRNAPSGAYRYEVVDGQQRLRAIWDYLDGGFVLPANSDNIGRTVIANKRFEDLTRTTQKKILDFPVMVAEISNAREPEISRLFSRMQMGVRLNPPELRNAIQTGLRHAIDALARSHPFFRNARIPAKRFKHQDYLAQVFSICYHDAKRDLKAPQLKEDYEQIVDDKKYAPYIADCDQILDFMNLVNRHSSGRITQKWIFIDLCYFLFKNRSNINKISAGDFAKAYLDFDDQRRQYNAEPEALLTGSPSRKRRDLYEYIIAFKISGGERKNLQTRSKVVQRRFKHLLRE